MRVEVAVNERHRHSASLKAAPPAAQHAKQLKKGLMRSSAQAHIGEQLLMPMENRFVWAVRTST